MTNNRNQNLILSKTAKLAAVGFVLALAATTVMAAKASGQPDIGFDWIQDVPGNCYKADPNKAEDLVWGLTLTNFGPDAAYIEKAAFHSPVSGCAATGDNLDQGMFIMAGETDYSVGETANTFFTYNTSARNCGRVQVDAAYRNADGSGAGSVFLGEMIDYGVDCPEGYNIKGEIVVSSNVDTSWVISGPENLSGSGKFGSYTAKPYAQDYFISVPNLPDYKAPVISPGINQTLSEGQSIHFVIYYEPDSAAMNKGNIGVNSNIPTTWTVSGPQNFEGSGTFTFYVANIGNYSLTNVPPTVSYNGTVYALQNITPTSQTLGIGQIINFSITYGQNASLNAPTITTISNAQCGHLKIQWQDNSNNENGFNVYRSEQELNGDYHQYQLISTLNANTTSFTDTPALNKSYYYIVAAYTNSPAMVSPSQAYHSPFNVACAANIQGNIQIYAVNGNTTFDLNNIKDNDTITFQIMIDNMGPSDGYITKITDQMSQTLINARNLIISGPNAQLGNPGISGTSSNITLNVSGRKEVAGLKWVIKYDTTFRMTSSQTTDQINNCATIYYFDDSGTKTRNFCVSQLLIKSTDKGGLNFREVAP